MKFPTGLGYTRRRGAQRNAGTDDCLATNVGGARAGLVSDQCRFTGEADTYKLAV
ncbi:MAG: hypothetical protein WCA85_12650 [Paraburkholderia sp.]|uniref:hypothetical protein n=1 Tax=Paraburkholderia sp. TaxID=1926495 RepID=UPI003C6791C9